LAVVANIFAYFAVKPFTHTINPQTHVCVPKNVSGVDVFAFTIKPPSLVGVNVKGIPVVTSVRSQW
jgi:hypothetical protein